MKGKKKGFTIIEVALFLAVSGFIFIGLLVGVGTSLARQRYNDSVQNFAEFLRTAYQSVSSVQNNGAGNSGQAIYGKLLTFGESGTTIYAYDIVGAAVGGDSVSGYGTLSALNFVGANVIYLDGHKAVAYNQSMYTPLWDAHIQTTAISGIDFKGALMIIRSPVSGSIITYVIQNINKTVNVQSDLASAYIATLPNRLADSYSDFTVSTVNFCVESPDRTYAKRRNIRLENAGRNSTAVQLIDQDSGENVCE